MADADDFPFRGWITWLTPEQGGRRDRPAHSPPDMALLRGDSLRSAAYRRHRPGLIRPAELRCRAWRSCAEGRWLATEVSGEQVVKPGSMIAVTEGSRVVAYFTVERVADS